NAFVEVSAQPQGALTLDELADALRDGYRNGDMNAGAEPEDRMTGFRERAPRRRLPPPEGGSEAVERSFDLKGGGRPMVFLLRVVNDDRKHRVFLVHAWASRRRYPVMEPELVKALDSFRVLP